MALRLVLEKARCLSIGQAGVDDSTPKQENKKEKTQKGNWWFTF